MARALKIGTDKINGYIRQKELLEPIAFCLLIKQTFRSSVLFLDNVTENLRKLHLGYGRYKRLINESIRLGYAREEKGRLIAAKLHGKGLSFRIPSTWFQKKIRSSRSPLQAMIEILQMVAVINHVKKQQDCKDTHNRATSPDLSARCRRKAVRREDSMLCGAFNGSYMSLSYKRISQLLGCGVDKVSKIIGELVSRKALERHRRWQTAEILPELMTSLLVSQFDGSGKVIVPSYRFRTLFLIQSCVYQVSQSFYGKNPRKGGRR